MSTGWRLAEIRDLTLWDVKDLNDYWATCPPMHVLVAQYLGVYKPTPAAKDKTTPDKLKELASVFGIAVKEG